jgi:hypothetical protein
MGAIWRREIVALLQMVKSEQKGEMMSYTPNNQPRRWLA